MNYVDYLLSWDLGSGRTGLASQRLGLDFVGVELSPEYHALAERILRDESPLFS